MVPIDHGQLGVPGPTANVKFVLVDFQMLDHLKIIGDDSPSTRDSEDEAGILPGVEDHLRFAAVESAILLAVPKKI